MVIWTRKTWAKNSLNSSSMRKHRHTKNKAENLVKSRLSALFVASLRGFEPPAYRLGVTIWAVIPCQPKPKKVSIFKAFRHFGVNLCKPKYSKIKPDKRTIIRKFLDFSNRGDWCIFPSSRIMTVWAYSIRGAAFRFQAHHVIWSQALTGAYEICANPRLAQCRRRVVE